MKAQTSAARPPLLGSPPAPGSHSDSPPPTALRTEPGCVHVSLLGPHGGRAGGQAGGEGEGGVKPPAHTARPQALSVPKPAIRETQGGQTSPPSHQTQPRPAPGGPGWWPKGRVRAAALTMAQGHWGLFCTKNHAPGSPPHTGEDGDPGLSPILWTGELRLRAHRSACMAWFLRL